MWRNLKEMLETRLMLGRVRKGGWGVRFLEDGQAAVACSVGLPENTRGPEVCVSGLPESAAIEVIEAARFQIRAGELTLSDGAEWPWNPESENGPLLIWRRVHSSQLAAKVFEPALKRWTQRGMRPEDFRVYQAVIADDAGRFPWQEGYDEAWRRAQQHLYLPKRSDELPTG